MARKTYKVKAPEKEVDPSKLTSERSWAGKRILDNGRVDSSLPSQGTNWKHIVSQIEVKEDGTEEAVTYCDGREISRYRVSQYGKSSSHKNT
jgi:hypothetical protein